jgi:DNA invertase Pin-like site-specific DNA recombinase
MDVVAYLRVSTDMQDINAQKTAIYNYAKERGYNIVKEYFDEDVSGKVRIFDRPSFKQLLQFVSENGITRVLVYDLTRLGRYDPLDLLNDIRQVQSQYNIIFEFVNEPQIEDPMFKKLWEFIKSWYSEFERLQISNRTRYGLQKLKEQGKLYHRPSILHYYACTLFNKNLNELTRDDVEKAKKILKQYIDSYLVNNVKKTKIPELLMKNELKPVYLRFPKAPKNPMSIYQFLKKEKLL